MKRLFLALLCATVCLTGCQKDLVTLKLEMEAYDSPAAKLHVENRYSCWDNNDIVMLNGKEYPVAVSGKNATIADVEDADNYLAVYPASMVTSASGNSFDVEIPTIQHYRTTPDGYQVVEALMAGVCSSEGPLRFHNIESLLKITFTSATPTHLRKIKVRCDNGPMSGCGGLAIPSEDNINFSMNYGCDSVVLDCGLGVKVEANTPQDFYIAIPPSLYNVLFEITVTDDFQTYSHTLSQRLSTGRNTIYSLGFATDQEGVTATPHAKPLCNQIFCTFDPSQPAYPLSKLQESFGTDCDVQVFDGKTVITVPYLLTELPVGAFGDKVSRGNYSLIGVTLPEGLTKIGDQAFCACWKLATVKLPSTLTQIGESAFHGCNFQEVVLPTGLTTIGKGAFAVCNHLQSITIPYGVTRIEEATFSHTSLYSITLPASVTYIGKEAFNTCTHLNEVNLNEGLIEIGREAFSTGSGYSDCHLTSIDIPSTVTTIGDKAFYGCQDLETVSMCPVAAPSIGTDIFPATLQTIYLPQNSTGYDQNGWEEYSTKIRVGNF